MGKKRVIKKGGQGLDPGRRARALSRGSKTKVPVGVLHVQSTFNNTKLLVTDPSGNAVMASSSGALGFKGAKKGTPFAAAKVGEVLAEKAEQAGMKEVRVVVKGIGSGRESAIRAFTSRGIAIANITDTTPIPHNGPKPKKPRRV
ncbi:MAG: 30S ribosomal protein S11 [Candidatus Vogelbacteria bacterium CG10_big_fil_rev_8_21_14_0_10_51_16]|uniref:Small ribosomal subunit protein uS11 n=1 Tax=Candidatus Vogelbacteria bacterium CG10_big_fil_rev_8_21_14_0_10_51_16 TaxID=1975045 RepID=A0A2H0RGB1_9BACT|nr:MAG: 30S ribosomal protein S11 [Candidatus Vogelbacteria bacterium CG10_big_fil_rev_8_21_14_0_10_51_16]